MKSASPGSLIRTTLAIATTANFLTACGGDGGDGASGPTVSSVEVSTPKYMQALTVVVSGEHLDEGLDVVVSSCEPKLSTAPPHASSATTAYYECPAGGFGIGPDQVVWVNRSSDGVRLASTTFTIPLPEITMTVTNGLGVSGDFVMQLRPDLKPITVRRVLNYAKSGYYDGTIFHYVFPGVSIEGGDYLPYAPGSPRVLKAVHPAPIDEDDRTTHLQNVQWTVSSSGSDSGISIALMDLPDQSFTFGSVIAGREVLRAVEVAPCVITAFGAAPGCLPAPNVVIASAVQTR